MCVRNHTLTLTHTVAVSVKCFGNMTLHTNDSDEMLTTNRLTKHTRKSETEYTNNATVTRAHLCIESIDGRSMLFISVF